MLIFKNKRVGVVSRPFAIFGAFSSFGAIGALFKAHLGPQKRSSFLDNLNIAVIWVGTSLMKAAIVNLMRKESKNFTSKFNLLAAS